MATTGHSKDTVFKLDNSAASLTSLSGTTATASFERSKETDNATVHGQQHMDIVDGLADNGEIAFDGPADNTFISHLAGIWNSSVTQTAELNPIGTATGRRKATCETILTEVSFEGDIGSTGSVSCSAKVTGAVTWGAN